MIYILKARQKENEKKIKIQQSEIFRIKSLIKQVNEEMKKKEAERAVKKKDDDYRENFMAKRLNSLRFEEPELELKLSDEISGNLRNLKVIPSTTNIESFE